MASAQICDNCGKNNLLQQTLRPQDSKWHMLHKRMDTDNNIWLVFHQPFGNFSKE